MGFAKRGKWVRIGCKIMQKLRTPGKYGSNKNR